MMINEWQHLADEIERLQSELAVARSLAKEALDQIAAKDAEIARLREALTTALLYIEFEPIRPELEAVARQPS